MSGDGDVRGVVPPVRVVGRDDVAGVSSSLAGAFADDPVMTYLFPDGASRVRRLQRFFAHAIVGQHLAHQCCFTDADRLGAALWDPPGQWELKRSLLLRAIPGYVACLGRGSIRALRSLTVVDRAHPAEPHYYLAVLGTRPEAQGRGIGSAVLAPILDRCDEEGVGAYLESSKPANIPYYRAHGFDVTGRLTLPGGPDIWPMWRDPDPGRRRPHTHRP